MSKIKRFSILLCTLVVTGVFGACMPLSSESTLQSSSQTETTQSTETSSESSFVEEEIQTKAWVVDENNYQNALGGEVSYAPSDQLTKIRGDYEGNAVKLSYVANTNNYRFRTPFYADELNGYKQYGYTHVSLQFAVVGIQSGSIVLKNTATSMDFLTLSGQGEYPLTAGDNKTWYTLSMPIDEYKKTLFVQDETTYCRLLQTGDSDAYGADGIYFYLGNVEVIRSSSVFTVHAATADKIYNRDIASTYVSAISDELMDFSGGYVGGAKRFAGKYANARYQIENAYTLEQLNALKAYYTSVTLWLAFDNIASGQVALESWSIPNGRTAFNAKASVTAGENKIFTLEDNGVWHALTVSIDDFITIVTVNGAAAEEFYLFRTVATGLVAEEGEEVYLYIGDVFFE